MGGSSDDWGWALALDDAGNAVVTGIATSSDFPTTAGAYDNSYNGGSHDVFVLKLAADGGSLLYSTFVGGSSYDKGEALALDGAGNAVVMGFTGSSDFPTTAGAYDTSHNGNNRVDDVFVLKLAADGGSLLYSTFVGGSRNDPAGALALDSAGNAVVTGFTQSSDFPTTAGAYGTTHNGGEWDGFIFKLAADGGSLLYSTFLGGNGDDYCCAVALDGEGNAVATAQTLSSNFPTTVGAYDTSPNGNYDLFVLKLAADGGSLLYSTLVGGSGRDDVHGLALDSAGNAVVTGITWSSNFPTTAGAYDTSYNGGPKDIFVLKLAADWGSLLYSTFLGGIGDDSTYGNSTPPLDGAGNALVTGWTGSSDFPTTDGAYDTSHNGNRDVFITKLAADGGSLLYSTFVGGSSNDEGRALALDGSGNAVVTGLTSSSNFPTTVGTYDTSHNGDYDVFVLRFDGLGDSLPVVWIDPPEKSVYPSSEPFTITVAISDVVDLAGFEFTMTFSPTVVHVEDVVLGDFLESTGRTASTVGLDIDNEAGTVAFGAYSVGTEAAPDGSGVLATLTLSPQASGESDLHLHDVQAANTVPEAIPVSIQDGHVRVCIFGDFDCDCDVDVLDIMLVAVRWNTSVGDPDYDPTYDIDGDGDIDILDILLVAVHWGETCE